MTRQDRYQFLVDAFYKQNGNCCAGCDHWRFHNHLVGECTKSQLMPATTALEGMGIFNHTGAKGTSHALTKRDYVCGNFIDSFDWDSIK